MTTFHAKDNKLWILDAEKEEWICEGKTIPALSSVPFNFEQSIVFMSGFLKLELVNMKSKKRTVVKLPSAPNILNTGSRSIPGVTVGEMEIEEMIVGLAITKNEATGLADTLFYVINEGGEHTQFETTMCDDNCEDIPIHCSFI